MLYLLLVYTIPVSEFLDVVPNSDVSKSVTSRESQSGRSDLHASGRGEGCLNRVREIQCTSKAVCNPVQDVNVKGTTANIKSTVS